MDNKIDFVIMWVDGSDPKWAASYNEHVKTIDPMGYTNPERYRDYDILKYWFRGVEEFAPWVNRIHFVTWGHIPDFLDSNNPKINIVNHSDFLEDENLPVFSSRPIEVNLHRIKGLAEQFVYFNDDMFLLKKVDPSFFFKKGKPRDGMVMKYISGCKGIDHVLLNDIGEVNKLISKRSVLKKSLSNLFNIRYTIKDYIKNLSLIGGKSFPGFVNYHMPQAYTKSNFNDVWSNFESLLTKTSRHKFRDLTDVNQYLFRFWALVKGDFYPTNMNRDRLYVGLSDNNERIYKAIRNQSHRVICINDEPVKDFDSIKESLNTSFEKILPNKSGFEK